MNNTQVVYDAQKLDIVLPMYYLIECSDAYSKISGSLWQYYWEEKALNNSGEIIDFLLIIIVLYSNLSSK